MHFSARCIVAAKFDDLTWRHWPNSLEVAKSRRCFSGVRLSKVLHGFSNRHRPPAARLGLINDDKGGLQEVSLGNSLCHKLFHFPCLPPPPPHLCAQLDGKPSAEIGRLRTCNISQLRPRSSGPKSNSCMRYSYGKILKQQLLPTHRATDLPAPGSPTR